MDKEIQINYDGKPCYKIKLRNNYDQLLASILDIKNSNYKKICIVTDSNVAKLHLEEVKSALNNSNWQIYDFIFDAGEASKNIDVVQKLYEELIRNKFDRYDALLALGGGVVGDLTGFTAATYLRGIDFIQIPTTLLSQVDSSIGGKTGVDFKSYKNMVGAFHMPRLVYMNIQVLRTLPESQLSSGMGEVIKHGLIQDKDYYSYIKSHKEQILSLDDKTMIDLVYGSCMIKGRIVEEDPKEANIRGYLNFGHTIGHAVEKLSNFTLSHGECVSLGMVSASYISMKEGHITEEEFEDIKRTLSEFHLPIKISDFDSDSNEVLLTTKSDKKMVGNQVKFIELNSLGEAFINRNLSDSILLDAINYIMD